jgi:hypothetical protein
LNITALPGIEKATAAAVKSALGLALKLSEKALPKPPLLDTPDRIADLMCEELRTQPVEMLHVVLLNTRRRLIKTVKISQGTLDTLLVHRGDFDSVAANLGNSPTISRKHYIAPATHKEGYAAPDGALERWDLILQRRRAYGTKGHRDGTPRSSLLASPARTSRSVFFRAFSPLIRVNSDNSCQKSFRVFRGSTLRLRVSEVHQSALSSNPATGVARARATAGRR